MDSEIAINLVWAFTVLTVTGVVALLYLQYLKAVLANQDDLQERTEFAAKLSRMEDKVGLISAKFGLKE